MKNFYNNRKYQIIFNIIFILINVAVTVASLVLTALGWNVDFRVSDKVCGIFAACSGMFLVIVLSIFLGATIFEVEQEKEED